MNPDISTRLARISALSDEVMRVKGELIDSLTQIADMQGRVVRLQKLINSTASALDQEISQLRYDVAMHQLGGKDDEPDIS